MRVALRKEPKVPDCRSVALHLARFPISIMAKRNLEESDDVQGYIHNVSPLKKSRSNTTYFDAQMQVSDNLYHRLVVFDPQKLQTFSGAAANNTPLKLAKVRQSPNKFDVRKTDIVVNNKSNITVTKLNFGYRATEVESAKTMTVDEVIKTTTEHQKVNIKAHVLSMGETQEKEVRGSTLKFQEICMADQTNHINLTLWQDPHENEAVTVETNRSYLMTNLTTREFHSTKSLTTTRATEITRTEELQDVVKPQSETSAAQKDPNLQTVTGDISQVVLNSSKSCLSCKRKSTMDVMEAPKFYKCSYCNMRQKVNLMTKSTSGTLYLQSSTRGYKLAVFNDALMAVLSTQGKTLTMLQDSVKMEEFLLELPEVAVTFNSKMIIKKIAILNNESSESSSESS